MKSYRTVENDSEFEIVINKSRFIGECHPVSSEEDAQKILDSVRKKYWDAKHHCYAFCIGENRQTCRSSDDGEPSGTAGAPILDSIVKRDLTNVICIVTRYFGGVLLGTGGLVRAYSQAASNAIRKSNQIEMLPGSVLEMELSYQDWSRTQSMLEEDGYSIMNIEYGASVKVSFLSLNEKTEEISEKIRNRTDGRVQTSLQEERMIPAKITGDTDDTE